MKREIEKKYLLKDKLSRDNFVTKLFETYPKLSHKGTRIIISYFYERGVEKDQIISAASKMLNKTALSELNELLHSSMEMSIKCRSIDATNYLCVKGTPSDEDPVHATNRLEFEAILNIELEEINRILQNAGLTLISKWSSIRDVYEISNDIKVDLEFVSGYGYKAELEMMIDSEASSKSAINTIDLIAKDLGLIEVDKELMSKMYSYYNENWERFFNTDKVFNDETWGKLGR